MLPKKYLLIIQKKYLFDKAEKQPINVSKDNIYNNIKEKNCFINNFIKILTSKYIDIFNNLNNKNITENGKDECVLMFFQNRIQSMKEILNNFLKRYLKQIIINYSKDI